MQSSSSEQVVFNSADWLEFLRTGQHAVLCAQLLAALEPLTVSTYAPLDPVSQQRNDAFVEVFLFIFAHPDFLIPEDFVKPFIGCNHRISNLVANSRFQNTDPQLELLRDMPNNFVKILILWSARNLVRFDRAAIFQTSPHLASLWYMQFAELFHAGLVSPVIHGNLREHFSFAPPELLPVFNLQEPYFGASYMEEPVERIIKPRINEVIQKVSRAHAMPSTAPRDPRKIAVVSTLWQPNHSVYRICSAFIEALRPAYHLTFIQLGDHDAQETAGFDACRRIESMRGLPRVEPLLANDFQMVIYPDIGMSAESIVLANMRLAPIQMGLLGHSVSTFGAEIDYFVSGEAVEVSESPERNYSERLVLLPGMGCVHNAPLHTRVPRAAGPKPVDRILVNCPWLGHKINVDALRMLRRLLDASTRPVTFRFYIGGGAALCNDYPGMHYQIQKALGTDAFELLGNLPYADYMAQVERGHLSLDAWPFGGCNTVSDSLFLRVPMVCRQGGRWYNRIGPEMLRLAGLGELIAADEHQFLSCAHRLIHEDAWRESLTDRLERTDLSETIYNRSDVPHFVAAVRHLMEHHPRFQDKPDRSPLRFPLKIK